MIILDTNVLSELMKGAPEPKVVVWLDKQPGESLWITSVTLFELRMGIALLDAGRRRTALASSLELLLKEDLEGRVLPFDEAAAAEAAELGARRKREGHSADIRDTQIAGIALARRATLATRNVRHFASLKSPVVNPWD